MHITYNDQAHVHIEESAQEKPPCAFFFVMHVYHLHNADALDSQSNLFRLVFIRRVFSQ